MTGKRKATATAAAGLTGVSASAAFTSSGNLAAPKTGDVLTYTVTVVGDGFTINPGSLTVSGVTVPVTGGMSGTLPEVFGAPVVTGITLSSPFTQQADPHVWKATVA